VTGVQRVLFRSQLSANADLFRQQRENMVQKKNAQKKLEINRSTIVEKESSKAITIKRRTLFKIRFGVGH
jgi:hypothetical protein